MDVTVLTCCHYAHFLKSDGDKNTEELTMQHIYNYVTNEEPIVTELTYINFFQCENGEGVGSMERFYL